jgi:hypothetical protein
MAVTRPTVDDLIGWRKLNSVPTDETLAVLNEAFEAAVEDVESRIDNTIVVAKGFSLAAADNNYPQVVRTAVLMEANRYAKRAATPTGVEGFGGQGLVVRVGMLDPDVERLIRRFRLLTGFY